MKGDRRPLEIPINIGLVIKTRNASMAQEIDEAIAEIVEQRGAFLVYHTLDIERLWIKRGDK